MNEATLITHALLVQAFLPAGFETSALLSALSDLAPAGPHAALNEETNTLYVYLALEQATPMTGEAARAIETQLTIDWPQLQKLRVSRLEQVFKTAGASSISSSSARPVFHYAVEMDPEPGWETQLFDWYDTEHMPGLAKVEGCIQATRFLNHDHGPRSLACYDLVTQETLGSPAWLAVRGTEWSSRMRPHFTHTTRTMFKVMG